MRREVPLRDGGRGWQVVCPNAAAHAPGRGDHALLLPPHGAGPGWIQCQRSACLGVEDWLLYFTPAELQAVGLMRREARIRSANVNQYAAGVRLCVVIEPIDQRGDLPDRYLRVSPGPAWDALWSATGVDAPIDHEPDGDLGGACAELKGRRLRIEYERPGEGWRVRRILAPGAAREVAA